MFLILHELHVSEHIADLHFSPIYMYSLRLGIFVPDWVN